MSAVIRKTRLHVDFSRDSHYLQSRCESQARQLQACLHQTLENYQPPPLAQSVSVGQLNLHLSQLDSRRLVESFQEALIRELDRYFQQIGRGQKQHRLTSSEKDSAQVVTSPENSSVTAVTAGVAAGISHQNRNQRQRFSQYTALDKRLSLLTRPIFIQRLQQTLAALKQEQPCEALIRELLNTLSLYRADSEQYRLAVQHPNPVDGSDQQAETAAADRVFSPEADTRSVSLQGSDSGAGLSELKKDPIASLPMDAVNHSAGYIADLPSSMTEVQELIERLSHQLEWLLALQQRASESRSETESGLENDRDQTGREVRTQNSGPEQLSAVLGSGRLPSLNDTLLLLQEWLQSVPGAAVRVHGKAEASAEWPDHLPRKGRAHGHSGSKTSGDTVSADENTRADDTADISSAEETVHEPEEGQSLLTLPDQKTGQGDASAGVEPPDNTGPDPFSGKATESRQHSFHAMASQPEEEQQSFAEKRLQSFRPKGDSAVLPLAGYSEGQATASSGADDLAVSPDTTAGIEQQRAAFQAELGQMPSVPLARHWQQAAQRWLNTLPRINDRLTLAYAMAQIQTLLEMAALESTTLAHWLKPRRKRWQAEQIRLDPGRLFETKGRFRQQAWLQDTFRYQWQKWQKAQQPIEASSSGAAELTVEQKADDSLSPVIVDSVQNNKAAILAAAPNRIQPLLSSVSAEDALPVKGGLPAGADLSTERQTFSDEAIPAEDSSSDDAFLPAEKSSHTEEVIPAQGAVPSNELRFPRSSVGAPSGSGSHAPAWEPRPADSIKSVSYAPTQEHGSEGFEFRDTLSSVGTPSVRPVESGVYVPTQEHGNELTVSHSTLSSANNQAVDRTTLDALGQMLATVLSNVSDNVYAGVKQQLAGPLQRAGFSEALAYPETPVPDAVEPDKQSPATEKAKANAGNETSSGSMAVKEDAISEEGLSGAEAEASEAAMGQVIRQLEQTLSELQRAQSPARYSGSELGLSADDRLMAADAGVVLLWPHLKRLFQKKKLLTANDEFTDESCQLRAMAMLVSASGLGAEEEAGEAYNPWASAALLTGLPVETLFDQLPAISNDDRRSVDHLLQTVVAQWSALKKMPVASLQSLFLQRRGYWQPDHQSGWKLEVENKSLDVLLNGLPWPVSVISLPWLDSILTIDWKTPSFSLPEPD